MSRRTWRRLLFDVGGLIERRSLWAAPLVVAFVSFVALVGFAINWLMSNPPDGLRQSWAGEISAVLIANAGLSGGGAGERRNERTTPSKSKKGGALSAPRWYGGVFPERTPPCGYVGSQQ